MLGVQQTVGGSHTRMQSPTLLPAAGLVQIPIAVRADTHLKEPPSSCDKVTRCTHCLVLCLFPACVCPPSDAHKTGVAQEAAKTASKVSKGISAQEARQILQVDPQASWVDVSKVRQEEGGSGWAPVRMRSCS